MRPSDYIYGGTNGLRGTQERTGPDEGHIETYGFVLRKTVDDGIEETTVWYSMVVS